jgi:hypothetical protein
VNDPGNYYPHLQPQLLLEETPPLLEVILLLLEETPPLLE